IRFFPKIQNPVSTTKQLRPFSYVASSTFPMWPSVASTSNPVRSMGGPANTPVRYTKISMTRLLSLPERIPAGRAHLTLELPARGVSDGPVARRATLERREPSRPGDSRYGRDGPLLRRRPRHAARCDNDGRAHASLLLRDRVAEHRRVLRGPRRRDVCQGCG